MYPRPFRVLPAKAELARLRAMQAGFLERVAHLQTLLKVRLKTLTQRVGRQAQGKGLRTSHKALPM